LLPENYLRVFIPDLLEGYQHAIETGDDSDRIIETLLELKGYALNMVRYTISPDDSVAVDSFSHEALINSESDYSFTIEGFGVVRVECIGSTTVISGREKQAAEIIIVIYEKLV
jgi:hypothetical protein